MRPACFVAAVCGLTLAGLAAEPVPVASPIAKGPLTSIELNRKTLTLITPAGPRSFAYTDRTYFFQGRARLSPDLLKSGTVVAVRYYTDPQGRLTIHRLKVPLAYDPAEPVQVPPPSP